MAILCPTIGVSLYVLVVTNDILCTGRDKCHLYVLVGIYVIVCTGWKNYIPGTCIWGTCIQDKDIVPNWHLLAQHARQLNLYQYFAK